jgi:hypothetical protein
MCIDFMPAISKTLTGYFLVWRRKMIILYSTVSGDMAARISLLYKGSLGFKKSDSFPCSLNNL